MCPPRPEAREQAGRGGAACVDTQRLRQAGLDQSVGKATTRGLVGVLLCFHLERGRERGVFRNLCGGHAGDWVGRGKRGSRFEG